MKDNEKPRLLDLFCGAGGCAMGYSRAGFDVVGVDIAEQPNYPFEFHRDDAIEFCIKHGHEFDAIHASPPCQRYSVGTPARNRDQHPDLISATREAIQRYSVPYIIENVPGAPLRAAIMLCGSMFGLRSSLGAVLRRHRLFETTFFVLVEPCTHQLGATASVVGSGTPSGTRASLGRNVSVAERRELMGIDWMTREELSQAIPPAYTEFLGRKLFAILETGKFQERRC